MIWTHIQQNNHHCNKKNPKNAAHIANNKNHVEQCNPNNSAYHSSCGKSNGTNKKWQCTNKYLHSCWMENRTWKPCTYLFCWGRWEYHISWLASNWKYLIHYHIIYPKFIFLVLKDNVEEILKQILQKNPLPH